MPDMNLGKEPAEPTLEEALLALDEEHKAEWERHFAALERESKDPNFRATSASVISKRQAAERSAVMDRFVEQANHEYQEGLRSYPNKHLTSSFGNLKRPIKNFPTKQITDNTFSETRFPQIQEPRIDGYVDTSTLKGLELPDFPSIISPKLEEPELGEDRRYKKIDLLKKFGDEM